MRFNEPSAGDGGETVYTYDSKTGRLGDSDYGLAFTLDEEDENKGSVKFVTIA